MACAHDSCVTADKSLHRLQLTHVRRQKARRCMFVHMIEQNACLGNNEMLGMTMMDKSTHDSRHHLTEIDLICSVLMEDSKWLDSYQTTVLEKNTENADTSLNDFDDRIVLNSNQLQSQLHGQYLQYLNRNPSDECYCDSSHSFGLQQQPSITAAEFHDLPAPEFVFGSKSVVATETLRLLQRAANPSLPRKTAVNQTIMFKRPRSVRDEC